MTTHWYLVYTKPKREAEAEQNLINQSYQVYLPRHQVQTRRRSQLITVTEPLFSRYLFVKLTQGVDNLSPIRSTRGALGLVRMGSSIAVAPPGLVEYLQDRERQAQAPKPSSAFKPGDKVIVVDGPFAGYDAIYQSNKGEERAMILLGIMHKMPNIVMPLKSLTRDPG